MSTNNMIGMAVLGLGSMGKTHVEAGKTSSHVDRVFGYEPDSVYAARRGQELEIETTADLDSILENPKIHFVTIAANNEVHAELAIRAMRAGKAVLCEKPMGTSLEEAEKMLAVMRETGAFLQIGFELRYSRMYLTVRKWIDEGFIGRPVNSHLRYYCSEFHKKGTWRSRGSGSFLIGEKLSHYLDLQRWYLGMPVEEVYSMAAPNAVPYFNHPDNHQINMRFQGGGVSNLNFVMHLAETDMGDPLQDVILKQSDDGHCLQTVVFGTHGAIEADVFRRRIRRWEFTDGPKQLSSRIVETITFPKEEDSIWFHNVHGQVLCVAERVAMGMPPENSAEDAYETMKLVFAAERSEQERHPIALSEIKVS